MKFLMLLACLLALLGCSSTQLDPFSPPEPKDQIFYQVYGFQLDQRESKMPSVESEIVDSKYAESLALSGIAENTFALMRLFQENGIDFETAGSCISIDPTANGIFRIGSPYRRYYIVVANTTKNLNQTDEFMQSKLKGTLLGARNKKE